MAKYAWIFLGVFLLLFGIFGVTNIEVQWGRPIMGFSALIAGIICLLCGIKSLPPV
jgi:hypothetical protein